MTSHLIILLSKRCAFGASFCSLFEPLHTLLAFDWHGPDYRWKAGNAIQLISSEDRRTDREEGLRLLSGEMTSPPSDMRYRHAWFSHYRRNKAYSELPIIHSDVTGKVNPESKSNLHKSMRAIWHRYCTSVTRQEKHLLRSTKNSERNGNHDKTIKHTSDHRQQATQEARPSRKWESP